MQSARCNPPCPVPTRGAGALIAMTGGDGCASNPFNDSLPEQALRADQEKGQRDHIGEPALDATAHQRPPVELAELLADADDEAADDCARNRGETAKDQH